MQVQQAAIQNQLIYNNYWYNTGTPSFLIDMLQKKQYDLTDLNTQPIGAGALAPCEPDEVNTQSLLLQTGYLTISGFKDNLYYLDFPNLEVRQSFFESIATRYGKLETGQSTTLNSLLLNHINNNDIDNFFTTLKRFFANIPYDISINNEKYYQSLFYAIFTLLGLNIAVEVITNIGQIDTVIITKSHIYIIEFKFNKSSQDALQQIKDKQYAQKYQGGSKEVVLVGVNFSQEQRNIELYSIETAT